MPIKVLLDIDDGLPKLGQRTERSTVLVQGTSTSTDLHPPAAAQSTATALRQAAEAVERERLISEATDQHNEPFLMAVEERLPLGRYVAEDPVCAHGVALDVHCCNCHSDFIFDLAHECSPVSQEEQSWADLQASGGLPEAQEAADQFIEPLWGATTPPFTYLSGPAGCGKTFAVKDWQAREKGLMLLATTGIAAINLGGTTINAALGYFDTRSLQESYTNGFLTARLGRLWKAGVRRLVLDECSMLEGDALTYLVKGVEEVNGRGYVLGKWDEEDETEPPAMGLTLVGDFAQLSPVQGTFAFQSPEWPRFAEEGHTITLTEIRRQSDPSFVQMLRQARVGNGQAVLSWFRQHSQIHQQMDDSYDGPTLFAKNDQVQRYNWIRLGRVDGPDLYYESRREGDQRSEWGNPKKPANTWGIPLRLHLKVGALVMVLANQRMEGPPPQPFIYVNGDLGEVIGGDEFCTEVRLQRTGRVVEVTYVRREVQIPIDSARRRELRDKGQSGKITENGKFEITGWVEYMPLRVAYASTVHKSQGLSLDAVQVNIHDAFFKSPGMLYVALSRARTAEGLRLVGSEAALVERCVADPRLKAFL